MRKSFVVAIAVVLAVLVVAFALSLAYNLFGVDHEHLLLNASLIVALVLVTGVLLFLFWWRSMVREDMVRRFFVSADWVYNHEIGYAPMRKITPDGDAYGFVTFAADALAKMSYGFEVAEAPDEFTPRFLISSWTFRFHFSGGDEDLGEKADGVVVDQWSGLLERVEHHADGKASYVTLGEFENARELARLLEDNDAFAQDALEEVD